MKCKIAKIFLLLAFIPSISYANGGGPLLLFVSGSAFLFGQVWILSVETAILKWVSGLEVKTSFKYVFFANLLSTITVGLGFPLLIAVISAITMELPLPYGNYASIIGTWIYNDAPYLEYIVYFLFVWLLTTFILTIYCEKWFYRWYWKKTGFDAGFSLNKFVWGAHAVSYSGLVLIGLVMWHDISGM